MAFFSPLVSIKDILFFSFSFFLFFFFFCTGALSQGHSTSPFFVMGIFEIGSFELFVQAAFKPQPS
jgi:hypothetical protein